MAYCAYCGSHVAQVSYVPCASCGNPTNGAPPRPRGGATSTSAIIIGVIAGGLAIIFIVGILAAIAIPNLLTAMQRSRSKRTMADIRTIGTALEAYAQEKGAYPDGTIGDLQAALVPAYSSNLPRLDGWAYEMKYERLPDGYALGSAGADKTFDQSSLAAYPRATTENFDCDIIYANGEFVQYPALPAGGGQ